MKKEILIFLLSAVIGFGGGFLIFDNDQQNTAQENVQSDQAEDEALEENATEDSSTENAEPTTQVPAEADILSSKSCLSCHAVSSLGAAGGATGPDLSKAFLEVEGKHGKPLEEFLKEPTSAVMSTVIAGNPLTDEEISQIVEALKLAANK